MLTTLSITHFAIIDHVILDFKEGMTVLAGETGAGKSIIIDAIGMLAGGRGSADFIQEGADKFVIQGQYQLEDDQRAIIQALLDDFGLGVDLAEEALLLQREINRNGNNTVRINGQIANVRLLKALGENLVDIHGQNEHQALLNVKEHMHLLDEFADPTVQELRLTYEEAYLTYQETLNKWEQAREVEADRQQRLQFLEFQANEIEDMQLEKGEYSELLQKSKHLQHAQLIQGNLQGASQLLSEGEGSVIQKLQHIEQLLAEIIPYQPQLEEIAERVKENLYELEDVAQSLAFEGAFEEADESLDTIEGRLSELSAFKRKYQKEIDEIITYYDEISEEIYQIKHHDRYLEELEGKVLEAYQTAYQLAEELREKRHHLADILKEIIEDELSDLYMKDASFEVKFTSKRRNDKLSELFHTDIDQLTAEGLEQAEFFVATNVGESLKPLVQVASGGELSRLMLALKTAFSRRAKKMTMIFDEIDTGVSGRVAEAIAHKIKENAYHQQVLCITHLPQVAAIADQQLLITKEVVEGRTTSSVEELTDQGREEVLAQMLSGEEITHASRQMARDLLKLHQEEATNDEE